MTRRARPLAEVLAGGALGELAAAAAERRSLTERMRAALPADAAAHLVGAATTPDGDLELSMDSPAWAARVRYSVGTLDGRRVLVRVRPARREGQSARPGRS